MNMGNPYPLRPGEQDCRDYLRTGRCKYGESCKYNHPLNVESGGGMKPINPGEPMFPIRPTEPPCQYFLKHGTCKFGQSCKFNHPSGSPLNMGGVDGGGGLAAGQLVFVTTSNDSSPQHLMAASASVQVLPQRPTEPNCIYFLRNGKCKYGATCKFHHPLDAFGGRNGGMQQVQATNMMNGIRAVAAGRDRSQSAGTLSEGLQRQVQAAQQQQQVSYVPAPHHRLQPITERSWAQQQQQQQPTHILLPDGQIAVILDPQSLQNVAELSSQDRPRFYLSQGQDLGSLGTLHSVAGNDQGSLPTVTSPMLTATTTSTSSQTFDSSIDLMGTNVNVSYQGGLGGGPLLPQESQSRGGNGPHKSGSGGSLSAFGSVDSGSHPQLHQGEYSINQGPPSQQVVATLQQQQQVLANMGQQASSSFPQYSAWPLNEGLSGQSSSMSNHLQAQQQQQQVGMMSPRSAEALDRQHRGSVDSAPSYYWPSSGSFSNMRDGRDAQAIIMPSGSGPVHRSYSAERGSPPALTSEQMRGSGGEQRSRASPPSGGNGDDEGLTMMTSALLTMMDRHDGTPPGGGGQSNSSRSEPNLRDAGPSPVRPPPGMMMMANGPPGIAAPAPSAYGSELGHGLGASRSPPSGGYFVGGYDQPPAVPRSPPWGG